MKPNFSAALRMLLLLLLLGVRASAWSAEKIQLRFATWDGDQALKVLRKVANDFEKVHPNVEVLIENVDWNNYFNKLLVQYAANVAPDVAMLGSDFEMKFAKRGALLCLDDFIAKTPGFDIKRYYPNLVNEYRIDGKLFILPRDIAPFGLVYYNKRLFDEAGLPYPDGKWTWDFQERPELKEKDFLYVLRKLSKKDPSGKVSQWSYVPWWIGGLVDTMVFSQGLVYANDHEHPTTLNFTDPQIIKTYDFASKLMLRDKFIPSPSELSSGIQSTAIQLFLQQKVAMYQSGIWDVPIVRESIIPGRAGFFDWDIALMPAYKNGTLKMGAGGAGYSIISTTPHPKEAWELVQWMAGEPGMMAMANAGLAQPAIRDLALREPFIPGPNTPLEQQYPHNRIITDEAVPMMVFPPRADYWREISVMATAPTDNIYSGTMTAKEALELGQKQAEQRLATILREEHLSSFDWLKGGLFGVAIFAAILVYIYYPERHQLMSRRDKRESRIAYAFLSPWLIGMLVFTVGPMILSLLMGLADWDIIQPARWRGTGNYAEAFAQDPMFWNALKITGIYSLFSVPLGIMFSLALALLLNTKVKGMPIYRTCFYLPSLASAVAASLIWMKIFQQDGGLLNMLIYGPSGKGNFLGLATLLHPLTTDGQAINWLGSEKSALISLILMSLWGVGGGMVILLAGLQGIPQYFYEAAELDGASPWSRFKAVTVPLLTPSLFFTLITGVIGSFQVFTQAFVMTNGGPNNSTRFYMYHLYDQGFGNLRMGYASALGWILFVVILAFTLAQWRLNKFVYYEGASA